MKFSTMKSHFRCPSQPNLSILPSKPPHLLPITNPSFTKYPPKPPPKPQAKLKIHPRKFANHPTNPSHPTKPIAHSIDKTPPNQNFLEDPSDGFSRMVVLGATSLGLALLLLGIDGGPEALALGPGGPMMEDFWDNIRRYGLYILTVSTGVIYTIFQPILELLKNPISAILIIAIFGGSIYIMTQVLSLMFGISEFAYDYGY
ncbi:uncharacterized protein LOC131229447 [Magnolia sinica]|uniref:uncharacterized protein LOC131229447 n=1 Tax=Magnolia sinica TaxID=86752 RepID=UPI00265ABED6|nr:uncharacterized protein LOC131229447 [Magnolia sinica]